MNEIEEPKCLAITLNLKMCAFCQTPILAGEAINNYCGIAIFYQDIYRIEVQFQKQEENKDRGAISEKSIFF